MPGAPPGPPSHPPVVRDDDDRARKRVDGLLQLLDQCRRQVIGRFVQQQQVGVRGGEQRHLETPALPEGQVPDCTMQVVGRNRPSESRSAAASSWYPGLRRRRPPAASLRWATAAASAADTPLGRLPPPTPCRALACRRSRPTAWSCRHRSGRVTSSRPPRGTCSPATASRLPTRTSDSSSAGASEGTVPDTARDGVNRSGSGGGATASAVSCPIRCLALRMRPIAPWSRPRARNAPCPNPALSCLRGMAASRTALASTSRALRASSDFQSSYSCSRRRRSAAFAVRYPSYPRRSGAPCGRRPPRSPTSACPGRPDRASPPRRCRDG